MKTIITLIALAAVPPLVAPASAQVPERPPQPKAELPVWRNDPMYSTHNYKHPNKAAAAQRRNPTAGVAVTSQPADINQVANYKMPAPQRTSTGGITVPYVPGLGVANRNYKMPRPNVTTIEVKTDVPTRRSSSATGE